MRPNGLVVYLLLGFLAGGVAGYVTRPQAAEIRLGGASIEVQDQRHAAAPSDSLTSGQTRHVFTYAAVGGIIGLLVGFAADRRA